MKVPGINNLKGITGCEKAGNLIIEELANIHASESGKVVEKRLLNFEEIHLDNKDLILTSKLINKNALDIFKSQDKTIFLGGDQSVTFHLARAFMNYCNHEGKRPCLLIFDSRPNCSFAEGKNDYATNENWLKKLVEEGFNPKNIMVIGATNVSTEEREFLIRKGIIKIGVNSFLEDIDNIADTVMEFCNGKEVYVSIDINVLDGTYSQASFSDFGGLTVRQLLYVLQRINKIKNLKALDIVEINPDFDVKSVKIGAKILAEIL